MASSSGMRLAVISFLLLSPLCCCITSAQVLKQIGGSDVVEEGNEQQIREAQAMVKDHVCDDDDDGGGGGFFEGLQSLCPVACFRPHPVCGSDGVTYWCGCREARCANVPVSHVGFCKIRSSAYAEKGSQALLLLHTLWLVLLGLSCLFDRL